MTAVSNFIINNNSSDDKIILVIMHSVEKKWRVGIMQLWSQDDDRKGKKNMGQRNHKVTDI